MTGRAPTIRQFVESIQLPYDHADWQVRYMEKKLGLISLPIHMRENLDKRARGGSKTFDTMEPALYLASLGFRGIWFGAAKDQIDQPKKYMKFIIENSYLKFIIAELLKESVTFLNGGELKLRNLTEMNARSSRADFIVYDEEAQADKDAYNAAVNILAGSPLGLVFHISTPTKGSVFEENHDRLKRREVMTGEQFIFSRTWEDVPHLAIKRDWYEEQKRILPGWYFRQEHEASFELPMGAVFQNVQYGEVPAWLMNDIAFTHTCSGVDWNPVSGHWVVSGKWSRDWMHFVITAEYDMGNGYVTDMNSEQFYTIARIGSLGNHVTMEQGGINEEYVKWFRKMLGETRFGYKDQNFHYEEWDSQGLNKLQAVTNVIQNGITIWCDRQRFPNLAKMIEDCRWDPDASEPKLAKDPASSPHALDAFLHALSKKNKELIGVEVTRFYK